MLGTEVLVFEVLGSESVRWKTITNKQKTAKVDLFRQ